MLCTGCGTRSTGNELTCGGCTDAQRTPGDQTDHRVGKPAIFQVGQAMQQQAIPDRHKRWQRAQRRWSRGAIACLVILIIFVITAQ